jgi:hypothetical protein
MKLRHFNASVFALIFPTSMAATRQAVQKLSRLDLPVFLVAIRLGVFADAKINR